MDWIPLREFANMALVGVMVLLSFNDILCRTIQTGKGLECRIYDAPVYGEFKIIVLMVININITR